MILISLSAVAAFPDAAFSNDKPYVSKKLHYAYITGYSDGSFRPYEFITRQEAAVIVCRLTDIASDNVYKKFKDVGADNWSYDAVERLYNMGIISGYDDGSFRPEVNITRAEFAVMLYGFTKDNEPKKEFWDLKDHWAKEYIEKAAAGGWFAGYTDGKNAKMPLAAAVPLAVYCIAHFFAGMATAASFAFIVFSITLLWYAVLLLRAYNTTRVKK